MLKLFPTPEKRLYKKALHLPFCTILYRRSTDPEFNAEDWNRKYIEDRQQQVRANQICKPKRGLLILRWLRGY